MKGQQLRGRQDWTFDCERKGKEEEWQKEKESVGSEAENASNELFEGDWKQTLCKWAENITVRSYEMLSSCVCPSPFAPRGILNSFSVLFSPSLCVFCSFLQYTRSVTPCTHIDVTRLDLCMCAVCAVTDIDQHPDCLHAELDSRRSVAAVGRPYRLQINTRHFTHSLWDILLFSVLPIVMSHLSPSPYLIFLLSCPPRRISWSVWLSATSWRRKWTERTMKSTKVKKKKFLFIKRPLSLCHYLLRACVCTS